MRHSVRKEIKRFICFIMTMIMVLTSMPVHLLAAGVDYNNLSNNKTEIVNNKLPVEVAKPETDKTAADLIKNPDQAKIYTLRTDYKVPKNGENKINYQPYVASVGENATEAEKAKVNKDINLPDLKGYVKPQNSYNINFQDIVAKAKNPERDGFNFVGTQEFVYGKKQSSVKIVHKFQNLEDFNKYEENPKVVPTQQTGYTGSVLEVNPIRDSRIDGFEPEADVLPVLVPEDTSQFEVEFRYNRKTYEVNFKTDGGSSIPTRLVYFEQTIPTVKQPTRVGSKFMGWKPSVDLKDEKGNTFKANEPMKDSSGNAIMDLKANVKMPATDVTFTAVWDEEKKADYVIQFWTEKPDYNDQDDTLALRDRYDFIGSRRIDNADTGSTPDLSNLDIHNITFPDLNDGRLEKAQDDKKEFERYYFLNEDLTKKQNASEKDPNVQKSVLSTGETVYNVYYDRRVYTLYFTAASGEAFDEDYGYWPIITRDGQVIGKEGSPYKVDVRFNQSLDGIWPKDAEVSGLPHVDNGYDQIGDDGLIGWYINHNGDEFLEIFRDTPPYRLSAEDFIDSQDVVGTDEFEGHGHADKIPIGKNETKTRGKYEISLGASYWGYSIVHHIDIIKDDFDGNEQIDYDLSYWKSDTNAIDYDFILPHLQGFTLKEETRKAEWVLDKPQEHSEYRTIEDLNNARNEKTPFRSDADKIEYIDKFPWGTKYFDGKNAYNFANYSRNKYKLKLNNDPKAVKNDNEYTLNTDMFEVPYELPLKDLELDTNHAPKRPDWVPDDWEFKGWALDPAGENLIKNGKETKLHYDQVLYAKWTEPDKPWKITVDPNQGTIRDIEADELTKNKVTVDKDGEPTQYPIKENNEANKQVFTVNNLQQLKDLPNPTRKGYDFLGWEWVRYKEDGTVDDSYTKTYHVPEKYPFGNDVVSNVYLKAIWVENNRVDVEVYHHFIDKDGNEIKDAYNPKKQILRDIRANQYVSASAIYQDEDWTLMPHEELEKISNGEIKKQYEEYNKRVKLNNTDMQIIRVEPKKILKEGKLVDNPKAKNNVFHFYYRHFRTRDYKVNYVDERGKAEIEAEKDPAKKKELIEKYSVIAQEQVQSKNRHYDARNYRPIPGWVLASEPQQQLFYDVDETTGEFKGINGTGSDEITFYYKDVRVIEVPGNEEPPEGYVRVTFKADEGGSFGKDEKGNDIKVIHYDVIKGIKSDLLQVPGNPTEDDKKEAGKYYITPDTGKIFTKWDEKPLLNENTNIDIETKDYYVFTAKFEWFGLSANELITTEAFKDPNGKWTNDFAPTIEKLKQQLVWREKDVVKPLPNGTTIKLVDEAGNELKTDEDVFKLVNEQNKQDKDELIRTVRIKAQVTFTDGKKPQELEIPVTVYKNVYEGLTTGNKPKFLSDAERFDLKDVTGNYVKVTVAPTGDLKAKDNKVYYVNPKAWVEIPKVDTTDNPNFTNWTADKKEQNEKKEENGIYDFTKRHKFTEDTVISPKFAEDVVEQKEGEDKPKVPDSYVKVIVKSTDKAVTEFTKTFWVNPTKEVTIPVTNPTGKENQKVNIEGLGEKEVNYVFKEWQKVQTGEADDKLSEVKPPEKIDLAKNKYTDKVTVIEAVYKKSIAPGKIEEPLKTTKLDTPQGKEITKEDLIKQITPQEGKEIESIEVISKPDPSNPGKTEAKVIVKYKDGSTQGTNDDPVVIPVEVHKNIIPEAPGGQKPEGAMDNYVKVIFKAGTGGTVSGDLVYYVSPEVEVDMTESAGKVTKTPETGYFVNGENWTNKDNKTLKGTFKDTETEFVFNFDKTKDIIEKIDENTKKPDGYVTVTFIAEDKGKKGKLAGNAVEKIYFVNPKADIKLVELADGQTSGEKQLAVPKTIPETNYEFDKWYEEIDQSNPITSERIHVAKFKLAKVTLTYDAGGAKGDVPAKVEVDNGTTIRLSRADNLSKENAVFAGWKLDNDDKIYQPGDSVTLERARTATAQWTPTENIIPYDPQEPITRPDGYVRVTFEADEGLTLQKVKFYYVKKNSGVTLEKLAKPEYSENVGYKFKNWDKDDSLVINEDVVATALSTPIDDVIEGKPGVEKPDGYVEVKFVAGENGTVAKTTYYVNPNKYVTLTPPTTKPNTGFEFGGWSQNAEIPTQYTEELTTITASFNPVDSVIPKTEDDQQKPDGYVTVNFVIKGEGGQIVDGETITYFVNPNVEVTIPQPNTKAEIGYEFEAWDIDTTTKAKYETDTEITGNFRKLEDIIPSTDKDGNPNAQPEGYVTVTFDKGANGNLTGQTSYYVNPNANKTLEDLQKPTVKPETGFKFKAWDTKDDFVIKADKTVTAQYDKLADVIPKTKDDDSEKPAGYIKVTFDTTEKGKIKDSTITTKVVFVNPNVAVVLKGFAPEVVANKGYEFERWDTSIEKAIQYNDGDTIKAIYKDDKTSGTTPGEDPDKPDDKPNPDKPDDKPNPDKPDDKPDDKPNPDKPDDKPGTVPENPGAIPGTTPGEIEKHDNRYVERVAGKDRVHTAINTSKRFFKKSKYVIIADSGNYPDALTATVLAHVLDAPILLNNTRYLEDDVAREIVRLGASEVIIVGGHKSISENVKSQLGKFDQNKVQRIWGRDRYVTSSELAYEIQRLTGKVNKAIIASGEDFPDALATAPLGSKEIAPILLVTRNQMDKKVSKALKDLNINKVYVAGGQNSVSKKLEAQLPTVIRRFSGQDRYETAILVASYTYPESKEVFVASGEVFPDALVIGPVCARRKAPILLSKSTPVKVTDDYIEKSKIEYLYIIGGTNTIYAETAHKYAIED
ncbi:hypothetical protein B9N51_00385 [Finegoldia magna]|uniref:cell wall-binding repeat-containing protein n=1 Tax=Finegoldia magna TaxID=1260 RepID=UPI000B916B31|nr:cell wall-binding repeat-containing protein [Finegoldia magna]OXZ29672.1 hypothetical protein B9N51_00385 [Finegoldia magna]